MKRNDSPSPVPAILGLLMSGPAHPYGLYREFDRELGRVWRVGQASLYAHLKRAEEGALAEVELSESRGAPDRRVHRITPAGRRAFLAWLRGSATRVRDVRLEFLARLYFFRRLGLDGLEEAAALQGTVLSSKLAALDRGIAEAAAAGDEYWRLVLEFRRSEALAIIGWLGACASR
jgi:DNA-binding PadR family transcriptional regulator